MVNNSGQRICHRDHVMTDDRIYVERRQDGSTRDRCRECRKENMKKFRERRPAYFRKKNKTLRQTSSYKAKQKSSRTRYRDDWLRYFKQRYGRKPVCSLCRKRLYWTHKQHGKRVCFDHRTGSESIKSKSPRTWIQNRPCNTENVATFEQCNFGILCRACNLLLPADIRARINMVSNIMEYLQEGLA